MKPAFAFLISLALLTACGEEPQQKIKQGFDNKFRAEFISAFAKRCVDSVPPASKLTTEQKQQICTCAADKAVDVVSAAELAQVVTGKIDAKLQSKLTTAVAPCINEAHTAQAASAAAAGNP